MGVGRELSEGRVSDRDWKGAEFFGDAEEEERLVHTCPLEYVSATLEDRYGYATSTEEADEIEALIRGNEDSIEVVGYTQVGLGASYIKTCAVGASESLADGLLDKGYIDPDGYDAFDAFVSACGPAIHAIAVRVLRDMGGPWACEGVSSHVYGTEELVTIARGGL